MKEGRIRYAKKVAIDNFCKINNKLDNRFKLTIVGDGKFQIIEDIIKQSIDNAINIYETGKPLKEKR
jgi:hypothetical protein